MEATDSGRKIHLKLHTLMGAGAPMVIATGSVIAGLKAGAVMTLAATIPIFGASVLVSGLLGCLIHRHNRAIIELVRSLSANGVPSPRSPADSAVSEPTP